MASKTALAKKPAAKKAPAKAAPAASGGAIDIGPKPLVIHQGITVTGSKFPPSEPAVITIWPDPRGALELMTDPFGEVQVSFMPVVDGNHHVAISCGGVKAERDFEVAAE